MYSFDKAKIREQLTTEQVFELLQDWGGEPEYTSFGIISSTICHNLPSEGSRKLYYYNNTTLFKCYTGCDSTFDIFELVVKVQKIQHNRLFDLNDAVLYIAGHFNLDGVEIENREELEDWRIFANYERIQSSTNSQHFQLIQLKEYQSNILDRFSYINIGPWIKEGIGKDSLQQAHIGYYAGGDQITIPHYDQNNRFIGLRGRTLGEYEAKLYGKYRPLQVNQMMYNHPLGLNLYNLNNSKNNIHLIQKAIVFESEKSTLQYQSYFGLNNDISVACCGSSISSYQIELLLYYGAKEIIIAFDRQFQEIGDKEFQHLKNNLLRTREKYKNYALISFIFDKNMITSYKASPVDEGKEKFLELFKNRIIL